MRYTKYITYILLLLLYGHFSSCSVELVLLKKKTNFYYPQAVAAFPHWELW